jgi:hypothetical protein
MPFIVTGPVPITHTLTLDALTEDAANSPLELNGGDGIGVLEMSLPAPPAKLQWSSSVDTEGSRLSSAGYENRSITLKVDCEDYNALVALQAKVAKIARDKGTLTWVLPWGETIVFDLLAAPSYEAAFDFAFLAGVTTVSFAFDAAPFGRGPERTAVVTTVRHAPLVIVRTESIVGDVPATMRLAITDGDAITYSSLIWGMRSKSLDTAATAALFYEAEACTFTRVSTADASASNGFVVTATVGSSYSTVLSLTNPTHVGDYRVYVRVGNPGTGISLRAVWRRSALSAQITNTATGTQATVGGQLLDLGLVRIPVPVKGVRAWKLDIQASTTGPTSLPIDYIFLVPAERSGFAEQLGDIDSTGGVEIGEQAVLYHQTTTRGGVPYEDWTPPGSYMGDYLLVPPGAPAEFIAKGAGATLGLGSVRDQFTPTVGLSATAVYEPRYLVIPGF